MPSENSPAGRALAGQVALITGASRGIGLAIAERLAEMGARLAICARDKARIEAAAAGLRKRGAEVFATVADVTRAADATRLVEETRTALGPVDILVNNAGLGWFKPFHEFDEAEWDKILDTNLKGVFLVSRAVAPEMIRRHTGQIINISSLAGKNTFPNGGVYCASKWGLMGLTGCMAEDLRGYGIRVASVCPGSVATEFSPHSGRDTSKLLQAEDVVHAVVTILTQAPTSFISEIQMRPVAKP
jgi:3-oxoacyl-[acyl-carrier protein] reductase